MEKKGVIVGKWTYRLIWWNWWEVAVDVFNAKLPAFVFLNTNPSMELLKDKLNYVSIAST